MRLLTLSILLSLLASGCAEKKRASVIPGCLTRAHVNTDKCKVVSSRILNCSEVLVEYDCLAVKK